MYISHHAFMLAWKQAADESTPCSKLPKKNLDAVFAKGFFRSNQFHFTLTNTTDLMDRQIPADLNMRQLANGWTLDSVEFSGQGGLPTKDRYT